MRFTGPYPVDFLFLKLASSKAIRCEPLCELFAIVNGVNYDPKQSNPEMIVFIENRPNGKTFKITKKDFIARLERDVFSDKVSIKDAVIQPEGEMQTTEVTQFLEN